MIARMANEGTLKHSLVERRKPKSEEQQIWDEYQKCDDAFSNRVLGVYEFDNGNKNNLWEVEISTGMRVSYNQIRKEGTFCDLPWKKFPAVKTPFGDIISTVEDGGGLSHKVALINENTYVLLLGLGNNEVVSLDSAFELNEHDEIVRTCTFERSATRLSSFNSKKGAVCEYLHSKSFKEIPWTYIYSKDGPRGRYGIHLDFDNDGIVENIYLNSTGLLSSHYTGYESEVLKNNDRIAEAEKYITSYFNEVVGDPPPLVLTNHGLGVVVHEAGNVTLTLLKDTNVQCITSEFPIFKVSNTKKSASLGPEDIQP